MASIDLKKFRTVKSMVQCLLTVWRKRIKKFEDTCSSEIKFGRGKKIIVSMAVEDVVTALKEKTGMATGN